MRTVARNPTGARKAGGVKAPMPGGNDVGPRPAVSVLPALPGALGNRALQTVLEPATKAPTAPVSIRPKLKMNTPGDVHEQEADRVAEQVMRMSDPRPPRSCECGGGCAGCRNEGGALQRSPAPAGSAADGGATAPHVVHDALRSPGQPLDVSTRRFMELRFGHDFGHVRVHADALAARATEAVGAYAYTVGANVVFGAGRYAPGSHEGRRLLAHELAHVVQQRDVGTHASLQRFHLPHGPGQHATDETPLIAATFAGMLATIKAIITASTRRGSNDVLMETFVQNAGGYPFSTKVDQALGTKSTPTVASMLDPRYLFSCRCGLIDLRHFIQLLYIANFLGSAGLSLSPNRAATKLGREHELTSEPESRFGPEDTPSNALGAFTGTDLAALPQADDLYNSIKGTLERCGPVDFASLSPASQDTVKHYYGDLIAGPGGLVPKNQLETAVPSVLGIAECGGKERSFPYELDTDDPDRKTISGTAFDKGSAGLKSDSDIRDFVATQRPEIIKGLPSAEKVRLVKRLFEGWVADEDIDAIEVIYKNSSSVEKTQIQAAINIKDLGSLGQRARMKVIFGS